MVEHEFMAVVKSNPRGCAKFVDVDDWMRSSRLFRVKRRIRDA